jgi:threonyl-tRNA synthetase
VWPSPEQVRVPADLGSPGEAAPRVQARLRAAGIRAVLDDSNETLSYRIRHAELLKIPYVAVVGQREADSGPSRCGSRGGQQAGVVERRFVHRSRESESPPALVP